MQTHVTAPEFLAVVTALELTTGGAGEVTQGRCFDLTAVFARVNAMYFAGQLVRPWLTWNRQLTGAKFEHYDFLRDTVLLSVTLDAPHVPVYVVDFVLYHELLHKQLGVWVVNGRRYAHTAEFRAAEPLCSMRRRRPSCARWHNRKRWYPLLSTSCGERC